MSDLSFTVTDTFALGLTDTLVFDSGSLSFVLFVLQILSFLPPDLQRTDMLVQPPTVEFKIFLTVFILKRKQKNIPICLSQALPSTLLPTFCLAHQTLQVRYSRHTDY